MAYAYHERRTVAWGHWGITFADVQPDHSKNYGIPVACLGFPVGNQGPIDEPRERYYPLCRAWIERGELPEEANPFPKGLLD